MLSIAIPTYNRPHELSRCLDSILSQGLAPLEILLVDDGSLEEQFLLSYQNQARQRGVEFRYLQKDHSLIDRGSSQSRNLALREVRSEIMLLLDDDIVLEKGFLSQLVETWERFNNPKLLGVGAVMANGRRLSRLERLYRRLFLLNSTCPWDVTGVGYQVWDDFIAKPCVGFYAHGGIFAYKVSAARELGGFREFSKGRNALEDVEFFTKAKLAGWNLVVDPGLRARHEHTATAREGDFKTGQKEMENRLRIFASCPQSESLRKRIKFAWSTIGWIGRQFLAGHFGIGFGMLFGWVKKSPSHSMSVGKSAQ